MDYLIVVNFGCRVRVVACLVVLAVVGEALLFCVPPTDVAMLCCARCQGSILFTPVVLLRAWQ